MTRFTELAECRRSASEKKIHAICIAPEAFAPDETTAFINEVRVTSPLVSFCLVGKKQFLNNLPDYHDAWKVKLAHYFKIESDTSEDDFNLNAGKVRDLFVADFVKCKGLGRYETTPGAIITLKSARPYMFWIIPLVTLLAGLVGPILNHYWPPASAPSESTAKPKPLGQDGGSKTGPSKP